MKRIALLLACTAFVTPALAADVVYEEPPAPAAVLESPGWTGFYVGIQAGGAFDGSDPGSANIDTSFGGPVLAPVITGTDAFARNATSETNSSYIAGAHAGYDYQINDFVVGAVVDVSALDYSEQTGNVSRNGGFFNQTRDVDLLATGRLRAGYLVTPSALLYATGGVAYGDVEYSFDTDSALAAGASSSDDEDEFGFSIGAGMDVKVTDNVTFGAEYLYTNLGEGDSSTTFTTGPFAGPTGTGSTTFSTDEELDFHTVTAKASYHFN